MNSETPCTFACADNTLIGIHHAASNQQHIGVVMVVGSPQYRVGSHRLYVYLARALAAQNISVFRFDLQGMGDSGGQPNLFCQTGLEIKAAIAAFQHQEAEHQTTLDKIILLGLCDGASAAILYTLEDIQGLIMLNPWVRSQQLESKARLKHHYLPRLKDLRFFKRIFSKNFRFGQSIRGLWAHLNVLRKGDTLPTDDCGYYQDKMLKALQQFQGKSCFVLSTPDLVAQEFTILTTESLEWQAVMASPNVTCHTLADVDHTFSSMHWKKNLADILIEWCRKL